MTALAAIHVAKTQLGLDDDTYRGLLVRVTGKRSAGDMSEAERAAVVEELRRHGFTKASSGARKGLEGRFAKKLQALWIGAWNLGLVKNRDDRALLAFVKRQTGIDHVRFLRHPEDAAKAIEALKAWMTREAGVDWSDSKLSPDWARINGYRIAWAQFVRLPGPSDQWRLPMRDQFQTEIMRVGGKAVHLMVRESDWTPVMNAFGERIRKAAKT